MFRQGVLHLFFTAALFGGVLDFLTLDKAKEAYAAGEYKEAASLYESLGNKNDDLRFNLGDAYYKAQKYAEALKQYEQVKTEALRASVLHNMGNAYAKSNKTDEAIAAYEEALKLSDDEDTKYNLELLKKQKEQQQKDQDQKEQEQKDDQQDQKEEQNADQKSEDQKKDKNGDQQKSQNEQQQDEEAKKEEQQGQAKEDEASEKEKREKEQQALQQNESQEKPISDMQQRKYEKLLEKRGIRTLMVPLKTEGAKNEETTAW